jgi:hypothetical protein
LCDNLKIAPLSRTPPMPSSLNKVCFPELKVNLTDGIAHV